MSEPKTLVEAIRHFADPDVALATMVELRWPTGVHCPNCGRTDVRFIATRRLWECKEKHPQRQFSAKVGTIFEDSALGLDKWFVAIWMLANCKNGVSSYELARTLGITQKSAWHMLHRIRLAMQAGSFDRLIGEVEVDETWIGGKARNMHKAKRDKINERSGSHWKDKSLVLGMLQRSKSDDALSHVRVRIIPSTSAKTLTTAVRESVASGSEIMTDALQGYTGLRKDYSHETVNHDAEEYVRGNVHTNGIENFWSLLKRTLGGTYVSVEPFHLARYLDEQMFRFNERKGKDQDRFRMVAGSVVGRRLTWKELTGYEDAPVAG